MLSEKTRLRAGVSTVLMIALRRSRRSPVQHNGEDRHLQPSTTMRSLALLCCLLCGELVLAGPAPIVNEILAAQVALDRAGFSPGEIDGQPGQNLQRALTAFQKEHQLPTTGQLDDATWKQLTEAAGVSQPLVEYSIMDADIAGPFTTNIPPTLPEQASLDALNYRSPLEAIAERVHSSPALLQRLNPKATFQQTGERIMVPNVGDTAPAAAPTGAITVFGTKGSSALTVEDAGGQGLF